MDASIQLQKNGAVATIRLNRPESGNALNLEMARALLEAALECEDDSGIRAVVLTGSGKAFCFGGDLQAMKQLGERVTSYLNELTTHLHAALTCLSRMPKVVVGAINGTAAGAGLGLVAMTDLAIAAQGAKFTSAYTSVGLTPDAGVSFLLPRVVGRKRAMDLLLNNRMLSAQQALEWGLVNEVVADDQVLDSANQRAEKLCALPTQAVLGVKRLIADSDPGLEGQLAIEGRMVARAAGSAEGQTAIQAFLARSKR